MAEAWHMLIVQYPDKHLVNTKAKKKTYQTRK